MRKKEDLDLKFPEKKSKTCQKTMLMKLEFKLKNKTKNQMKNTKIWKINLL